MRWTRFHIPTLRETPAEAEVISHRLMLKAGLIRKLAAGIYSHLPFGYRAQRKLEAIVREEMDRAGALEVFMPAVQPAELWVESGRWGKFGPELLRLQDRHKRDFCIGPTHEEVIVDLVRHELRSYRDLPRNFYQIQTKFRDEVRPRFGLMRGREFTMKDAYSFDADADGLDQSFQAMDTAYRRIFERCGVGFRRVEADSGAIGGDVSYEFHVLANSGEDAVVACNACDYAANIEKAVVVAPPVADGEASTAKLEEVETPGTRTVEEVTAFLGIPATSLVKTLLVDVDGKPVAVLVRGDHELSEVKLSRALEGAAWRFAEGDQIVTWTGGPQGFSGPVGLGADVRIIADNAVRAMTDVVVGANKADTHLIHANPGRDFTPEAWLDLRAAQAGEPCPRCGENQVIMRGIEVGHIFKLGDKYSQTMGATFLDKDGKTQHFVMGCYGLGIGRTVAASIEQNHDDDGIIWPISLAPFEVLVTIVNPKDEALVAAADKLAAELETAGLDVLVDDRKERPGVKFKDADLIGIPLRAVFGARNFEEGNVEISTRRQRDDKQLVAVGDASGRLIEMRSALLDGPAASA